MRERIPLAVYNGPNNYILCTHLIVQLKVLLNIYLGLEFRKKKQESKKTGKHALVQENTHSTTKASTNKKPCSRKKDNVQENTFSAKKTIRKQDPKI